VVLHQNTLGPLGVKSTFQWATVPVGQGRHFHAEYLFILRKLVSAEAKNRIILKDSYFHHTKNNFLKK
jgi:hypothetical protein